jgi:2-phospho-L-lactate guanylyltransferase
MPPSAPVVVVAGSEGTGRLSVAAVMPPVNPPFAGAARGSGSYDDPVPARHVEDHPTAVVPIRSFRDAKSRLAGSLDAAGRAALVRDGAQRVLDALIDGPVLVVSDDDEVLDWSQDRGVPTLAPGTPGLDRAATAARDHLRASGVRRIMVVHADIWVPDRVRSVADLAEIVLVPDLALDGTNVIVIPTEGPFAFAYGPGSFNRHLGAATHLAEVTRASVCVRRDRSLGHDIDTLDDLRHPMTGRIADDRRRFP